MMKNLFKRMAPGAFESARDAWYKSQWWAHRTLRRHAPEKKLEWDLARLARGARDYPVDPAKTRILVSRMEGFSIHLAYEAVLSVRLRQMGHQVEFLICDADLPFCNTGRPTAEEGLPCAWCTRLKKSCLAPYFDTRGLGDPGPAAKAAIDEIEHFTLDDCLRYEWNGLPLGELAGISVSWTLCRAEIGEDDAPLYRTALKAGVVIADRFPVHLDALMPDCVLLQNAKILSTGVQRVICQQRGIRYVTFEVGQFPDTLIVSQNTLATRYEVSETFKDVREQALTRKQQETIEAYFESRRGGKATKVYWAEQKVDQSAIRRELELDDRPIALVFTNVTWDSALLGQDTIFEGFYDWLLATVSFFAGHPDWQLLIRCHPAEVRLLGGMSEDRVERLLPKKYGPLPEHVHIVPSESKASSYALMDMARFGIVYNSTAGMEMVVAGKPVMACARGKYALEGITVDPSSRGEFVQQLEALMRGELAVTEETKTKMYRFAYHYFFERMIPFEPVATKSPTFEPKLLVTNPAKLTASRCPGFDLFCRGIAEGAPICFPRAPQA